MNYRATYLILLLILVTACGRNDDQDKVIAREETPPIPTATAPSTPSPTLTPTETATPAVVQPATGVIPPVSTLVTPQDESPLVAITDDTDYAAPAITTATATPLAISYDTVDNASRDFYFVKNKKHEPSGTDAGFLNMFEETGSFYLGDVSCKCLYLTIDAGYENGFTGRILDTLRSNNIKAAFFITGDYIKSASALVLRMVEEGHIVGNHTMKHPVMPDLTDAQVADEITNLSIHFTQLTGKKMEYFRPPQGTFSHRTLKITSDLGYRTVFWSWAFADWEVDKIVPKETIRKNFADNLHNGEIVLMHAVSETNVDTLEIIIEIAKEQGYEFRTLDEIGS